MTAGVLSAAERGRLPKLHGRDAVWAALRAAKAPLTVTGIWSAVNAGQKRRDTERSSIRQYLYGLARAGVVETGETPQQGVGGGKAKTYRLTKDLGPNPPKLRRDGGALEAKGDGRQRLWAVMRVMKEFDAVELSLTARVAEATADEYARFLAAAGYLAAAPDRPWLKEQGKPLSGRRRWRVLPTRWTGPRAPQITKLKALFDPNIGEIVYARRGRERITEGNNNE